MANLTKILNGNEKKISINNYLSACDGEDYVTIKKLRPDLKKKISFLTMSTVEKKTRDVIMKEAKKRGYTVQELESLPDAEKVDIFASIEFSENEQNRMEDVEKKINESIINNGLCVDKHTIRDDNGNLIKLDYELLNDLGNELLINYIIQEIKTLSEGYYLGEMTGTE